MTTTRLLANRYRLESTLGHGSMGTVWNAYDEVLLRRVAIKEVNFPTGIPGDEAAMLADRTLREARAIAALSHPHVITLFDIVPTAAGPAIVMELMESRSLAEILKTHGRLRPEDAAVIGRAVAAGLLAAHSAGITHRDVKPANVLISDDGRIKLTDFGIARAAGEQTLTATGMLLGSPAFISPEVAGGRPATPSADAWGLGALLYASTEGHPPFDQGKPIATLTAVVSDPVPPHPNAGAVGPVIDGLLVKDPGLRMTIERAYHELDRVAGTAVFLPPPGSGAAAPSAPANGSADAATPSPAPFRPLGTLAPVSLAADPAQLPATVDGSPLPAPRRTLPPPPWAADATAGLAPLPARAPERSRVPALLAALVVAVLAAVVGYLMVIYLARPS